MATDNNNGKKDRNGPGQGLMGPGWIIALVAYMLVVLGFIIYTMISIWPPLRHPDVRKALNDDADKAQAQAEAAQANVSPGPGASPNQSPSPPPAATTAASPAATVQATPQATATATSSLSVTAAATATASPATAGAETSCENNSKFKEGFCLNDKGRPRVGVGALRIFGGCYCIYDEDRLLIIVILSGALGALVHGFRSLVWYVGNRQAVKSWTALYVALPFVGSGISVIFYLVIRGGFFSPTSSVDATSPFGFAALAALIGMFTEPAVLKLRKVATTIFEPPEKGKDHVGPAPRVTQIDPQEGTTAGGDTVTVTGSDFSASVQVLFDKDEGTITSSTPTSITVLTPAHAKGKVDVTIVNDDTQQTVVKEGFEYKEPAADPGAGAGAADDENGQ